MDTVSSPSLPQVPGACTPSPFPPRALAFGGRSRGRIQEGTDFLSVASFHTCLRSFPGSSSQAEEVREGTGIKVKEGVGV